MLESSHRQPSGRGAVRGPPLRNPCFIHLFLLLFVLFTPQISCGESLGGGAVCARIPGLSHRQRTLCRSSPSAVAAAGDGVKLATQECRRRFSNHRWNCSSIGSGDVFGHVVIVGSREAAFTYAIASAGVAYAVTAACARGDIPACGCDRRREPHPPVSAGGWRWGGCGADVAYGARFARKFLDARELEGDARSLMNLHNNRAGRKVVKSSLRTECKCHGVSGSCTMKTCWKSLPPFTHVGEALMRKYSRSKYVTGVRIQGSHSEYQLMLKRSRPHQPANKRIPKRSELVFLEESPNYCERNIATGSLGTVGRFCNRTSRATDGCDLMCCGRGYNTHQVVRTTQCHCKFHWCCYVNCDVCTERKEEYTCK